MGGTLQADSRLLDILNEINHIWPGISTDPVMLMGFSGGAQFVNRFAYLYPERLRGVVIAAPGKTTKLKTGLKWPDGVADVSAIFDGMEVEVERFREELSGKVLMVVGKEDVMGEDMMELKDFLAGRKRSDGKRTSRVEGLKELRRNWEEGGIEVDFEVMDGVGHEYAGLLPVILKWLEEKVKGGI
ncbi:hypothetical protein HII31_00337 [Pseudocercospora fuligena]|uniref:Uncharacterized protein n=1 Tax=Pseudocercospora fuligena TaxID=685502 RepID=A0A8H6VN96_9PEZI|nr:hypothetical protein HII31_00337 [Pseudocercospora fuligena]